MLRLLKMSTLLMAMVAVLSVAGVYSTWHYYTHLTQTQSGDFNQELLAFGYPPDEILPDDEEADLNQTNHMWLIERILNHADYGLNAKKKPMVLVSGIIGTVAAVWLYNNFCDWLNVLNCTLPPVGIILILGYFMNKKDYEEGKENTLVVNWFAIAGVILGAVVANLVKVGIPSLNGMAVAAVCYVVGHLVQKK